MKLQLLSFLFTAAAVAISARAATPTNAAIPTGYAMTAVATGLNCPTAIDFPWRLDRGDGGRHHHTSSGEADR